MDVSMGTVVSVTANPQGASLIADCAPGVMALPVDWGVDFQEDGGLLAINGVTYEYDSMTVDEDADTYVINLTSPLLALAENMDSVDVLTASGDRAVEYAALVNVPGAEQPVEATIPTALIPFFPQGDTLEGVGVSVGDDGRGSYEVKSQPAKDPDMSLEFADPTTIPDPVPVAAPTETITLSVAGDATGITALVNETLSPRTLLNWYMDGVLVQANTRSNIYRFTADSFGSALLPDTDYTITALPINVAGPGTVSAPAIGRINPGVSSQQILGQIAAGFALLGRLQVGTFLSIDPDIGLVATHIDPVTGKVTQTSIPADGSGPHFAGTAEFETVAAQYLRLLGRISVIESGLQMAAGVGPPPTPLRVGPSWQHPDAYVQLDDNEDDSLPLRGLWDGGDYWYFTVSLYGGNVQGVDKVTGDRFLFANMPDGFSPTGGLCKVGTSWYVLGQDNKRGNAWYIYAFNSSWVKTSERGVAQAATITDGAITTYNGSLYVAYQHANTKELRLNQYNVDPTVPVTRVDVLGWKNYSDNPPVGTSVRGLSIGAADLGVTTVIVGGRDYLKAFTLSGDGSGRQSNLPNSEWERASNDEVKGLFWDGTRFHSLGTKGRVWHYARRPVAETFAWRQSNYDSDASTPNGVHESTPGGTTTYTAPRRSWIRVEGDPPNDGGGPDDPDSLRFYANNHRMPDLGAGVTSAVYDVVDQTGPGVRGDNQFTDLPQSIGNFTSAKGDSNGPYIWMDGNGNERHAKFNQRGLATVPASNAATATFDVVFPVAFNSVPVCQVTVDNSTAYRAVSSARSTTGFRITVSRNDGANVAAAVAVCWDAGPIT